MTGLMIVGSAELGIMVWTPDPGILKVIVSVMVVALASRIAWRKEPGPLSRTLVTTKLGPTDWVAVAVAVEVEGAVGVLVGPVVGVCVMVGVAVATPPEPTTRVRSLGL